MDIARYDGEVASRVKEAMRASRHTQYSLAQATGIARTTLARSLAGGRSFTASELVLIGGVLDVDPASLLRQEVAA